MGAVAVFVTPVLVWKQLPNVRPVLVTLFLLSAAFHIVLGNAILKHKPWARTAGIVWCVLSLFSPIAILGGYGLWCLTKGWRTAEAQVGESEAVAG